jgi:hypothetical protein
MNDECNVHLGHLLGELGAAWTLVNIQRTSSEHSGNIRGTLVNIQWTFREHSAIFSEHSVECHLRVELGAACILVNIQWTFRESWADAREPPSQLQEALKKSTKVDAEYNLQTWIPKTRVNKTKRHIPGVEVRVQSHSTSIIIIINWRCAKNRQKGGTVCLSGNIQGTLVNIQWTFREHSRNIQRSLVNIQWNVTCEASLEPLEY